MPLATKVGPRIADPQGQGPTLGGKEDRDLLAGFIRHPSVFRRMAVSPLGVLLGLILVFFAPGFALLHALFPGRRYYGPFHPFAMPALSVVMSVAITVLVGSILGFLPGGIGGKGWFQGAQTGAPILELTLAGLTVALLAVGWWRGAFPLLGRLAEYDNVAERGEPEEVTMLRDVRLEEERLRKEAARVRKRASESRDIGVRTALFEAAIDLDRERKALDKRAKELEARGGERRYGASAQKKQPRWRLGQR